MSIAELLALAHAGALAHARTLLAVCLLTPAVITLLAWACNAQRQRRVAHLIANIGLSLAFTALALEVLAIAIARVVFDAHIGDASAILLLAPIAFVGATVVGVHMVFPLKQLAAWRTLVDVGWFSLAAAALLWIMSQFRGWGILFGGNLIELALIMIAALWLIRRLYRRVFTRH